MVSKDSIAGSHILSGVLARYGLWSTIVEGVLCYQTVYLF